MRMRPMQDYALKSNIEILGARENTMKKTKLKTCGDLYSEDSISTKLKEN